jgi:hypothetical protein
LRSSGSASASRRRSLKSIGRLPKPVSWNTLFHPDLLRELAPSKVNYKLPEA